jgi:hypothetical protein
MPIIMPEERSYELPPPGSHTAICFRVIDLGTQQSTFGAKPQIMFSWELTDELMADGKPFGISRRYTFSANRKAALRQDVEGWLGRVLTGSDFGKLDLSELLGSACLIGVKHEMREDGRTFANVVSVMKRAKGVPERMSPTNEAVSFSLADRPFRQHDYDCLPSWLQEVIARSPEYREVIAASKQPTVSVKTASRKLRSIMADAPASKPVENPLDDVIPDF